VELRHIHHFLAVVKHRNLGRAAQELNIAQPALSKSIRRLEELLQVKLIERHPRGVEPTDFGKALASHAELIAVEVGHAMNAVSALREARQGHVTVGAAPGSSTHILPHATSALLRRHPDLRITVVGGLSDTLLDSLGRGALDFMISGLSGLAPSANLVHEKLFTDRVGVVARAGHPLTRQTRLHPGHLVDQKWILPNPNVLTRQQLEAFLHKQNLPSPEVVIETNSVLHIMAVLKCSDLLSFMPRQLIEFGGTAGDLVPLGLPEAVWRRVVGLSYRRRGFMSPASSALIEELRRMSREIYRD
jgi:LysR family transcriptional regulator of abg operon